MFRIEESWFRVGNRPIESLPPPTIKPLTTPAWRYVSPDSLATSGIYTPEDLSRLRDHIMFPMEKPSTLNAIARGAMGQTIPTGSLSMLNLLDEDSLNRIAENAGQRIWKALITFGSASAGILALFVILRIVKLVIDTIIHGYALHSIYGWSIHLLGAVWSSVTSLLLHLGHPTTEGTTVRREYIAITPSDVPREELNHTTQNTTDQEQKHSYSELRRYLQSTEAPHP